MKSVHMALVAGAALISMAAPAFAADLVITPSSPTWSNPVGENSGGGSAAITATAPKDGNGSIELHGDRTRYVMGDLYSSASNLGLASNFTDLAFTWMIDPASTNAVNADYSPALRIIVWDGGVKNDYVWEAAYNGLYGAMTNPGIWNGMGNGTFYKNQPGGGSENDERTLTSWFSGLSSNAYVGAVYIGVGSGIGGQNYKAYADDVIAGGNKYNFEVSSGGGGAVPEPATWAMMIVGFGLIGATLRRTRTVNTLA